MVSLDKTAITAPKQTITRRSTIDTCSGIGERSDSVSPPVDIAPHEAVEIDEDSITDSSTGGIEANIVRPAHQRSADAIALWQKWSNGASNIPFAVRGRRRSMFSEKRITLSPIKEIADEITDEN